MSLTESIFKIHKFFEERTSKKEADAYIRDLLSVEIYFLQEENRFTPENLEKRIHDEYVSIEEAFKNKVA